MSVQDVNPNSPNPNPGIGPPDNAVPDSDKGGHDRAKDDKKQANPKPMDPNNPTVASTDNSKKILDSIKQVDPGNVAGFIKKAVDAMMQIRAIDGASGGGGGGAGGMAGGGAPAATTSAAMGKGMLDVAKLLATAEKLGLKAILDALNSIMPALIPLLGDDDIVILDQAILAIITDTNVGVLSPLSLQTAQATADAIASVQLLNASSTAQDIINAVEIAATIGGPTLGVDPNSLANAIITSAIGTTIQQTLQLNNRVILLSVIINSSYISDQLANIPTFTGLEQQTIATNEAVNVTDGLYNLIVNNMLTAQGFLDILRQTQLNIQSASLKNAIGTDIAGIMGQIQSLISQFAGNIQDSEQDHQPRARLETVTEALQKHSKILALIKKKLDVSDIFQSMGSMAGQAQSQIQSMMGSIQGSIGSSGLATALQSSDIIPMTSTVSSTLQNILKSGQSPLSSLTPANLNDLLANGGSMLNSLTQTQVQSMLSALPPNLVMSLMGSGLTMMSNLDTNEMNSLLSSLPQNTVTMLLQGNPAVANFHSTSSTLAEQTSDIAAALSSVIATQTLGVKLMTILPNGTTVICEVVGVGDTITIGPVS